MKSVFLSDVHLRTERDRGYRRILNFLDGIRDEVERIFIVGDFFDFWFCRNGSIYPPFREPVDKILELVERGVRISIFEGNHDFELAAYFGGKGIEVYPEWADFTLEGQRFLVSHGDTVDRSNYRYLALRKILRTGAFYRLQEMMPRPLLWQMASASSIVSKGLTVESQKVLAEKMGAFAREKFEEGVDAVVLGHCHRPLLRQYEVKGRLKTFVTLGDWVEHFSYLVFEEGRFELSFSES